MLPLASPVFDMSINPRKKSLVFSKMLSGEEMLTHKLKSMGENVLDTLAKVRKLLVKVKKLHYTEAWGHVF